MRVLNHHVPLPTLLLLAYEFVASAASVYLGGHVRFAGRWPSDTSFQLLFWQAALYGALIVAGLGAMGLYQSYYKRLSGEALVARILAAFGLVALAQLAVFFLVPGLEYGRGVWALSLIFSFLLVILGRATVAGLLSEDAFRRRILVYGAGNMAASILALRRRSDQRGFKVIAFVPAEGDRYVIDDERVQRPQVPLAEFVQANDIDEIVIAMDDKRRGFPIHDLLKARLAGTAVIDILGFLERESGRIDVERLNPSWLIFADGLTRGYTYRFARRAFDLVFAALLLLIAWPFMLIVALAILLEDGRPILYRQLRVGEMGRTFELTKFRSMSKQAEADGAARWAIEGDPRVTRTGRLIRKLRLDELPQLLNIIRGEMSLVGPRPERPEFAAELARKIPFYDERHCVKPGLTGWAQLRYPYGASERDALEKLRYDLFYVKNQSFLLDVIILLQTAEVILWQKGSR